jgi:preprotein translocase subunit SecY
MPFCLNPECPHRKNTGKPAEFLEGITHCTDCGMPLSEEAVEKTEAKKPILMTFPTDLLKRILYTLGFLLLWRILVLIPVPGIDPRAFSSLFGPQTVFEMIFGYALPLERISLCGLGIMPYLSTYVMIEILSLFIQPLKSWRKEGYQGRLKIKRIALVATLLLALLQGLGLASSLENMRGPAGELIVRSPGWSFRILAVITLTTGTYLMIWIAELITKKGMGHGVSIFILAGASGHIFLELPGIKSLFTDHTSYGYFYLFVITTVALVTLIVMMEKSQRKIVVKYQDGTKATIPLKFTSAGATPAEWTSTLLMVPVTLLQFINLFADHPISQEVFIFLAPGKVGYFVAFSIVLIFLYYLFTSFFYNPKKIISFLENKRAAIVSPQPGNGAKYIDKNLEIMIPIAALYLCLIILAPHLTVRYFHFYLGGMGPMIGVAILLDLMEEARLRRKNSCLIKIAELHDVPMAGLVRSLLEQKGLQCCLRGYYHRALFYFFGPYIEISVLVPGDKLEEAREVIKNYFEENVLTIG